MLCLKVNEIEVIEVRPDIIIPVTWNDWYDKWIERILMFEDSIKFISNFQIRVENI